MYSLKIQFFIATMLASAGGALLLYLHSSIILSIVTFAVLSALSYSMLYIFAYRPLVHIQRIISAQTKDETMARVITDSSEEFQRLSDSLNTVFDNFRTDIVQMKKLERVRSEFLGNVSHELRTPLFSTQGLIETLLNGAVDDKKVNRDFLKRALANIQRLNSLLEELIDISRIESGEMKLQLRYFDIIPILAATISELHAQAEQKGIILNLDGPVDSIVTVFGDKERLQRVLINLIENAIKYSEQDDTVTVKCEEKNQSVKISIIDTGIGIAPQNISRIFERFYRADKDRSRDVGGSGLGLAIVKHIIEAHGSAVTVESSVGEGSTFSFTVKK